MGTSAVVPALLVAGGAYLLLRPDPATGQSALGGLLGGGAGAAPLDGFGDLPLSPYDPVTGQPMSAFDPFTGAPLAPYDPNAGLFPDYGPSPAASSARGPGFFARAFSPENLGFGAILAAPALFRRAPATVARAGSSVVRGVTSTARATGQVAARVAPRAATAVRFAAPAAAPATGLALGQGVVTLLERTGALDIVAQTAQRAPVSQAQRQAVQVVTAPLQYVGAVSTGLAGRGSVSGNVREVNQAVTATAARGGRAVRSGYRTVKGWVT